MRIHVALMMCAALTLSACEDKPDPLTPAEQPTKKADAPDQTPPADNEQPAKTNSNENSTESNPDAGSLDAGDAQPEAATQPEWFDGSAGDDQVIYFYGASLAAQSPQLAQQSAKADAMADMAQTLSALLSATFERYAAAHGGGDERARMDAVRTIVNGGISGFKINKIEMMKDIVYVRGEISLGDFKKTLRSKISLVESALGADNPDAMFAELDTLLEEEHAALE